MESRRQSIVEHRSGGKESVGVMSLKRNGRNTTCFTRVLHSRNMKNSAVIINISLKAISCKFHPCLFPFTPVLFAPTYTMAEPQLSSDEIQKLCSDLVYQVAYSFYDVPYIIILKMLVQYNVYVPKIWHAPLLLIYNKDDRSRFGSKGRAFPK